MIAIAVELHQGEDIGLGLKEPLYALDSTTIDLCLTLFPWADFRSTKAAVKAHTIVDLRGSIPVFVHITTGKVHDVNVLDLIHWPAGSIVVVDRGYLDFARLQSLHQRQVSFVIRAKDNTRYTWIASREVDKSTGLRSDQSILLATPKSKLAYPHHLRRVSFRDPDTDKFLVFLTNRFDLPAFTIAEIYRKRWQVETFFKWIKQNLSIKHFFGNSLNAVKSQVWIAVCVYLIVIIASQLVADTILNFDDHPIDNQLSCSEISGQM